MADGVYHKRIVPVSLEFLSITAKAARLGAEHEQDEMRARLMWASISAIEEAIAMCEDASPMEREIARREATQAARKAGMSARAQRLEHDVGEKPK